MSIVYTQTDTSGTPCGSGDATRVASVGGTAGSVEVSLDCGTSQGAKILTFQMALDGTEDGAAGGWLWKIDVTTAEMNATVTGGSSAIRHYDSGCSIKATLASSTTSAVLDTVTQITMSASSSAASVAAGDFVEIDLFISSTSHSATVGITPSQDITSPFSIVTTPRDPGKKVMAALLARRRFLRVP